MSSSLHSIDAALDASIPALPLTRTTDPVVALHCWLDGHAAVDCAFARPFRCWFPQSARHRVAIALASCHSFLRPLVQCLHKKKFQLSQLPKGGAAAPNRRSMQKLCSLAKHITNRPVFLRPIAAGIGLLNKPHRLINIPNAHSMFILTCE